MNSETPTFVGVLLAVVIPVSFIGIWLFVTSLLGVLSGWFRLQRAFPDRAEAAIREMRMQSGSLGPVNFNNCLRLDVCPTGLRLGVSRFLGPLQRPIFVPWGSIASEPYRSFFGEYYRFRFGTPVKGSLVLTKATATRIAEGRGLQLPS